MLQLPLPSVLEQLLPPPPIRFPACAPWQCDGAPCCFAWRSARRRDMALGCPDDAAGYAPADSSHIRTDDRSRDTSASYRRPCSRCSCCSSWWRSIRSTCPPAQSTRPGYWTAFRPPSGSPAGYSVWSTRCSSLAAVAVSTSSSPASRADPRLRSVSFLNDVNIIALTNFVLTTYICRLIHKLAVVVISLIGTAIVSLRFHNALQATGGISISRCGAGTMVLVATGKKNTRISLNTSGKRIWWTHLDCGDARSECMVSASVGAVEEALDEGRWYGGLLMGLGHSEDLEPSRRTEPRCSCSEYGLRTIALLRGGS